MYYKFKITTPSDALAEVVVAHLSTGAFDGFEINGQNGDGKKESDYIDKGIYAHGNRKPRIIKQYGTEFKSAIDGLIISNMRIVNFGGKVWLLLWCQ